MSLQFLLPWAFFVFVFRTEGSMCCTTYPNGPYKCTQHRCQQTPLWWMDELIHESPEHC